MGQRGVVLRRAFANGALRRIGAAFVGFNCAENGVWVSILVYAFERGGTTLAAGTFGELLPGALRPTARSTSVIV